MLENTQVTRDDLLVKAAEILGANLKAIRKQTGLRQDELAHNLKITAPSISRWENGLSLPDADTLDALAAFLGIPVWKLFFLEGTAEGAPPPKRDPTLKDALKIVNAHILGNIVIKAKRRRSQK